MPNLLSIWASDWGFYFEGDIGLCEINLAVRAASTAREGAVSQESQARALPHPACSALSSNPLCIITAGGWNKCCDIRLFNPLSSEKCILSRSNLLSLPVCLYFCVAALRHEITPPVWYFFDVWMSDRCAHVFFFFFFAFCLVVRWVKMRKLKFSVPGRSCILFLSPKQPKYKYKWCVTCVHTSLFLNLCADVEWNLLTIYHKLLCGFPVYAPTFLCTVHPLPGHKLQRAQISAPQGLQPGQECQSGDRHVSALQQKACKKRICRLKWAVIRADMSLNQPICHPFCQEFKVSGVPSRCSTRWSVCCCFLSFWPLQYLLSCQRLQ